MKWLNDDIEFTFTPTSTGYQNYTVYLQSRNTLIYTGTVYTNTNTELKIDITNILQNWRYEDDLASIGYTQEIICENVIVRLITDKLTKTQTVYFAYKYANTNDGDYLDKAVDGDISTDTFVLPMLMTSSIAGTTPDGSEAYGTTAVVPHIPYLLTSNFEFIQNMLTWDHSSEVGSPVAMHYILGDTLIRQCVPVQSKPDNIWRTSYTLKDWFAGTTYADTLYACHSDIDVLTYTYDVQWNSMTVNDKNWDTASRGAMVTKWTELFGTTAGQSIIAGLMFSYYPSGFTNLQLATGLTWEDKDDLQDKLDEWIDSIPETDEGNPYITLTYTITKTAKSASHTLTPVAKVDDCPARYYLMWQDRLGGIQVQAFKNKDTYTESITYSTIEDYQGHTSNYNTQVQSKWELNTDWVKDYAYPVYEGIFTSPKLVLYDTELDKSFAVIATDKSYTEKTYKNQKKLFNFNLNLTLDKKQTIFS